MAFPTTPAGNLDSHSPAILCICLDLVCSHGFRSGQHWELGAKMAFCPCGERDGGGATFQLQKLRQYAISNHLLTCLSCVACLDL